MKEKSLGGWSDLLQASYRGRSERVLMLIEQKADPNETDNLGRTALIHAAAQGHGTVVSALIAAGTDALYSPSTDGRTALHWAAFYGHRLCCDLLQEAGCDMDQEDNDGHSAQVLAILGGADFFLFPDQNSYSINQHLHERELEKKAAEKANADASELERALVEDFTQKNGRPPSQEETNQAVKSYSEEAQDNAIARMGNATWGSMTWVERLAAVEEEVSRSEGDKGASKGSSKQASSPVGGKGGTSPGIRTTSPLRGRWAASKEATGVKGE